MPDFIEFSRTNFEWHTANIQQDQILMQCVHFYLKIVLRDSVQHHAIRGIGKNCESHTKNSETESLFDSRPPRTEEDSATVGGISSGKPTRPYWKQSGESRCVITTKLMKATSVAPSAATGVTPAEKVIRGISVEKVEAAVQTHSSGIAGCLRRKKWRPFCNTGSVIPLQASACNRVGDATSSAVCFRSVSHRKGSVAKNNFKF